MSPSLGAAIAGGCCHEIGQVTSIDMTRLKVREHLVIEINLGTRQQKIYTTDTTTETSKYTNREPQEYI